MLFVIWHRAKDSVKHFQVTRNSNGYVFGFNEFPTLQDFVNHFANQPLLGSDTGMQTMIFIKKRNASYDAHIKPALKHTQEVYWQTGMYVHLYFFRVLKSACRAYNQPLSLNQEPSLFWRVRIHGVWRSHLFMNLCEFTLPYRQDAQKMIW